MDIDTELMNLSWNDFQNSTITTFNKLHDDEMFSDVTLACGDGNQIKAHRVILSSCSSFFKEVLIQNPHQHPLLYLKGVDIEDMKYLMKFIYTGQVEIPNEGLAKFLDSANDLQIKGLLQKYTHNQKKANEREVSAERKMFNKILTQIKLDSTYNIDHDAKDDQGDQDDQHNKNDQDNKNDQHDQHDPHHLNDQHDKHNQHDQDNQDDLNEHLKSENDTTGIIVNERAVIQTDYRELNQKINAISEKVHGVWTCLSCGKTAKDQSRLAIHIEGLHIEGFSHPCTGCSKMFSTRNSVAKHIRKRICKAKQ